jgi:predicted RNase H-like HicB family nuclease
VQWSYHLILFWNFGINGIERMVIMKSFKYVVYREGEYFVSQCLNVDIASFGKSIEDAVENLKDAVSLYLADEDTEQLYHSVEDAIVGEALINA